MPWHPYLSFISELTSTVTQADMESIYTKLALYGSKNLCARTDNVFSQYLRSAMTRFPFVFVIQELYVVTSTFVEQFIPPREQLVHQFDCGNFSLIFEGVSTSWAASA